MKIRIIGAGFYGCHIAETLISAGHEVEIIEARDEIFGGASGSIPARLHEGFHYPRSKRTRDACQKHLPDFLKKYGRFCCPVKRDNIYAIAEGGSLVDFPQYVDTLRGEMEFDVISSPFAYGLTNVEGAIKTGERHIVTDDVKAYFENALDGHITYGTVPLIVDSDEYDLTVDATFCAYDAAGVDRYEPCIVGLLEGCTDNAVTIMDGPFTSLYPWKESAGLCSISSAKWTPISKQCRTWGEAKAMLDGLDASDIMRHINGMVDDLEKYYPCIKQFKIADVMTSVRAMPLSGADSRLVDVVDVGSRAVRIRAGKIDAVIHAGELVLKRLEGMS